MTDITLDLDNIDTAPEAQPTAALQNTATEKQVAFINRLKEQKDLSATARTDAGGALKGEAALEALRNLWREGLASKSAASKVIDMLLSLPDKPREEEQCPNDPARSLEGMHKVGDDIYKVQVAVHGSGRLYAKRLVLTEPDCGGCANGEPCEANCPWTARFEYAPGAMRLLSEDTRLTLDEAKDFGACYGTCAVCGRTLTNEESIAAGIGPVCAGKAFG